MRILKAIFLVVGFFIILLSLMLLAMVSVSNADVASKNPIIQDEGTTVAGSGRILNFTGAGVAVTFAGGKYVITINGGAGSSAILDLGDDGSDESAGLAEIATTGDTNNIFTEPSADKLLISLGNDWPKADVADVANTGDSATAFFSAGTIEHERGGLEADVSAYAGLVAISAGATSNVTNLSGLNTAIGTTLFNDTRTITIAGTTNEISSSTGAQDLSANRTWTLSFPSTINMGGKTSFEIPVGLTPTTDIEGEIAFKPHAWATGRGTIQQFDGTANVYLIGALASDAPSNGQTPKWNTGGTITWEDDNNSGGATAWDAIADPSGNGAIAMAETAQTIDWNTNDITAAVFDAITMTLTNDAATDILTQRLLVLQNSAGANGAEALLVIANPDTDDVVTDGVLFDVAGGGMTTGINLSDAQIGDALNVGANPIAMGNNAGTIGDATTDSVTVITDGTGDGEVELPAGSIDTNEILDNTIGDIDLGTTESINLPVFSAKLTGAFVVRTPTSGDASTAGAQIDAGDGNWRLLFDATTDEAAVWQFRLPDYWAAHSELNIFYSMASATTLEVEFEVDVMCVSDGDSADVGADGFAGVAVGSATVPGTAGFPDEISVTITDDSCAAGDMMWVYISTDANDATADDATGDREVIGVEYEYTR